MNQFSYPQTEVQIYNTDAQTHQNTKTDKKRRSLANLIGKINFKMSSACIRNLNISFDDIFRSNMHASSSVTAKSGPIPGFQIDPIYRFVDINIDTDIVT